METRTPPTLPALSEIFRAPVVEGTHLTPTPPPVRIDGAPGAEITQRWSGLAPHRLKRVLACIEMRLAEPIQVCELADEVHMSPFHFTRMFKLATGHSPHKYITLQRVERAKELLATSELPIAAIAAAVGYQTQAHFTGVFSRHAGTTPKVYRVSRRRAAAAAAPATLARDTMA
ncbi:MAG TPA: AraC family transcriptional regulator [Usitatibacter sp.]|nr:AraC family transcriptional regulator [Usitatibacter sp.]